MKKSLQGPISERGAGDLAHPWSSLVGVSLLFHGRSQLGEFPLQGWGGPVETEKAWGQLPGSSVRGSGLLRCLTADLSCRPGASALTGER